MSAQMHTVDRNDIQGLLRTGYGHHTEACFLLLRISDREAARTWLRGAPVTSAAQSERSAGPLPETVLQVALSCAGLRALGLAEDVIDGFSGEFVSGMGGDANQARRLGDVDASAPERWRWGTGQRTPHVLVLLYALPGRLDAWRQAIEHECTAGFETVARLETSPSIDTEPFGFKDGISQPQLDWERQRPARDELQLAYGNLSCLGEFVLGYPNEYGGYTDRPLLDLGDGMPGALPRAEDAPDRADLGRNGSYLALRQLQQDVHGFWNFLDHAAGGEPVQREQLAAAMVGRTLRGVPLVMQAEGDAAVPPRDLNDFTYQSDPQGLRCPLGAHIRRANPRNADLPPGKRGVVSRLIRTLGFDAEALQQDRVASSRFHRLLRRGRKYGAASLAESLSGPPDADAGIHFICLGANLARQFEFVQNAWMAGTKFDGLTAESDPLLGPRLGAPDGMRTNRYSIPQADGPDRCVAGMPPFATVVGGGYFFLPGIRALRYLAAAH
jgi:deferrochelatase/peroxidase EfeB